MFLGDTSVRIRTRGDPDPRVSNTRQVCTFPITVKVLSRNAKKTEDWHEECCDGANVCDCKDDIRLKKKR